MGKIIYCHKLNKELPGLDSPPLPGELGEKILNSISQEAWDLWIEEQTKLINENKLQLFKKAARDFLMQQAEIFLFKGSSEQ